MKYYSKHYEKHVPVTVTLWLIPTETAQHVIFANRPPAFPLLFPSIIPSFPNTRVFIILKATGSVAD